MDKHLNRVHEQLRAHVVNADWSAFDDDITSVIATCKQLLRERDEARAELAAALNGELSEAEEAADHAAVLRFRDQVAHDLREAAEQARGATRREWRGYLRKAIERGREMRRERDEAREKNAELLAELAAARESGQHLCTELTRIADLIGVPFKAGARHNADIYDMLRALIVKNAELLAAIHAWDKAHHPVYGTDCAECGELYRIAEGAHRG